jgi:serine kinase of HPr protein (carbohydrate metabolism regulator)
LAADNLHGTAVLLADRGVLITGRSGTGKTTLALALIEAARARGRFARLVADDQLFVSIAGGRLRVDTPPTIRGLVEIHGLGPAPTLSEDSALIDLVVRLDDSDTAPRFQEVGQTEVAGVALPTMSLGARNARSAVLAIYAQLQI